MKKYENPNLYIVLLNVADVIQNSNEITPDGEYELPIVRPN